jgi:hypothetical protein
MRRQSNSTTGVSALSPDCQIAQLQFHTVCALTASTLRDLISVEAEDNTAGNLTALVDFSDDATNSAQTAINDIVDAQAAVAATANTTEPSGNGFFFNVSISSLASVGLNLDAIKTNATQQLTQAQIQLTQAQSALTDLVAKCA